MDIRLCPQEITVYNHKAKSSFSWVGWVLKTCAWAGFFVRTRVLISDPTTGHLNPTPPGVQADADAVFFFSA